MVQGNSSNMDFLKRYRELIVLTALCIVFAVYSKPQRVNSWSTPPKMKLPRIPVIDFADKYHIKRDPFADVGDEAKKKKDGKSSANGTISGGDFSFQGTITTDGKKYVFINDKYYYEGQKIGDVEIVKIFPGEIHVLVNGEVQKKKLSALEALDKLKTNGDKNKAIEEQNVTSKDGFEEEADALPEKASTEDEKEE